ncbi:MAG: hypothetical protein HQL13_06050 [Candidatus Omnitrophica bacterium]|nr:hypothetical protein [Candidatus Omnitrophota bacterium]
MSSIICFRFSSVSSIVFCSWDLMEEESIAEGGLLKLFDTPRMAPKKIPSIQSPAQAIRMMTPKFMGIVYNKMIMMRILFLVLLGMFIFLPSSRASLEIIVNGHKYSSWAEYQASKNPVVQSQVKPVSLETQEELYIRQKAKQSGVDVDFSKMKTLQVKEARISEATRHKLYVLSVENGVVRALEDFYQMHRGWGHIAQNLPVNQLEGAIQQAVTQSKSPKLLISEPGKLRIMSLNAK